ncbi:MAG: hypothetical protein B6247_03895 [Candidatus Parabeggiatoa sp. nov. 2]|nr:MAG: hypothetical protein B6247_03895 [Beggiatoa sp. 4572_84]
MAKSSKTPMTQTAAARIQSAEAKANSGKVAKGGFASRAQTAAAHKTSSSQSHKK